MSRRSGPEHRPAVPFPLPRRVAKGASQTAGLEASFTLARARRFQPSLERCSPGSTPCLELFPGERLASQLRLEASGPFIMMGGLRRSWRAPARLSIELLANRDFLPADVGLPPDPRRLAYLIERLALICRGGEEVALYTRPSSAASEVVGAALP